MFTGLIECIGRIIEKNELDVSGSGGKGFSLVIGDASLVLEDVHLGDSIAVEGVCLTVTEFDKKNSTFKVGIAPETIRKTNLNELQVDSLVNLERAVRADTRLGGHVVQGHVDTTVVLVNREPDPPNSVLLTFKVEDPQLFSLIVPKGYVTLGGASLTVVDTNQKDKTFRVMLIAYTQERITLTNKPLNSRVNVEVEALGKYVNSVLVNLLESPSLEIRALIKKIASL